MTVSILVADDIVAIAAAYVPEIERRRDEFDELRHLPQDLVERMAADGLYRICTPRDLGGLGMPPRAYAEVCELLGRADASVGWCTFIGITSAFSMARGHTADLAAILRTPGVVTSGVFAPTARAVPVTRDGIEGYVVTGRWQWGSGSRNAQWLSGGALIAGRDGSLVLNGAGKPQYVSAVFAADEVTMLDTWTVMGLQGTGSTDYAVDGVFVPKGRTFSRFSARADSDPIFRFPFFGMLALGIGAVALGAARGAIGDLLAFAGAKVPHGGRRTLAERTSTQAGLATVDAELRSARGFFYDAIDTAWDAAMHGEVTTEHRIDVRLATAHAVRAAKTAVDTVYDLAGGTAVYRTSTIQRRFRDIHVAAQHMMVNDGVLELVGRLMLDVPTDIDLL